MKLRRSRLLSLVREGQLVTSFKANLNDPRVIEIAGLCGCDAVWICNEHVPNDWTNLEHQIRAARLHDMDSLVRITKGSYSDYIRPFEADATGIIVPHVGSADEARQIVDWVRCHPVGKRPLDGGNTDGKYCLIPITDYTRHTNEERVVVMQIESPEALANVEAIAAVLDVGDGVADLPGRLAEAGLDPGDPACTRLVKLVGQLVEVVLVPLHDRAAVHRGRLDRHEVAQVAAGHHHAADVLRQVPREANQFCHQLPQPTQHRQR